MRLCDALGEMLTWGCNVSRVNVYCSPDERETAMAWFEKQYMFRLGAAMPAFEKELKCSILGDQCHASEDFFGLFPDQPFDCVKTDSGFMIRIRELEIRPFDEEDYYAGYGEKAFEQSLKDLKLRFIGLSYGGYVNYWLSGRRDGCLVSYEIKDDPNMRPAWRRYDWIWKTLGEMLAAQTYLPSEGMPSPEEAERLHFVLDEQLSWSMGVRSAAEDILGARLDEKITAETDYFIMSKKSRRAAKAKQAEKLGIPILTEDEFIEKFGLQAFREQGYPKNLWFILKHEEDYVSEEEAEETIRDLCACKEWIRQDVLAEVIRKIIRLVAKNEPDAAERLQQKTDVFSVFHPSDKPAGSTCRTLTVKVTAKDGKVYTYRESAGENGEACLGVPMIPWDGKQPLNYWFTDLLFNLIYNSGLDMRYWGEEDERVLPTDDPETAALKKVARSLRNKRERFIRKLEENVGEMKKIREVQCVNNWSASGADVDPIERSDANLRRLADLVLRGPIYRRDDFREEMRDYLRSPGEGRGGSVFAKGFRDVRYRFRGDLNKLAEEILYNEDLPETTSGREYFTLEIETGNYTEYAVYDLKIN